MENKEIFQLFMQTNEIRASIIQNIESQINSLKQVWISVYIALISSEFLIKNSYIFLLAAFLSLIFWITETFIKCNQRGYVFVSNQIQKEFQKTSEGKHFEIVKLFAIDLNGHYTFGNKNHRDYKLYKEQTSFFHTMFMKNVCSLYIGAIGISLILFFIKIF